jgi:hypothetical protein
MPMSDIDLINLLDKKVKASIGLDAGALPASRRARHGRREFQSDRFVELFAEKFGKNGLAEFSRIMSIDEAHRLGAQVVADAFCKHAANALTNIEMK